MQRHLVTYLLLLCIAHHVRQRSVAHVSMARPSARTIRHMFPVLARVGAFTCASQHVSTREQTGLPVVKLPRWQRDRPSASEPTTPTALTTPLPPPRTPRCAQVQRLSQRLSAWTRNHIVISPHLCSYSLRPYTAGRSVRSLIPLRTGTSAGTVGKDACAGLLCISTDGKLVSREHTCLSSPLFVRRGGAQEERACGSISLAKIFT